MSREWIEHLALLSTIRKLILFLGFFDIENGSPELLCSFSNKPEKDLIVAASWRMIPTRAGSFQATLAFLAGTSVSVEEAGPWNATR
jgi:hypothetical protein